MKLAIVGAEDIEDYHFVKQYCTPIIEGKEAVEILYSNGTSVGKLARRLADELNLGWVEYLGHGDTRDTMIATDADLVVIIVREGKLIPSYRIAIDQNVAFMVLFYEKDLIFSELQALEDTVPKEFSKRVAQLRLEIELILERLQKNGKSDV